MDSPSRILPLAFGLLLALTSLGHSQPAASSSFPVTANGMLLAQNSPSIEQSRLFRESAPPKPLGVDANGNAIGQESGATSDDDSFGAQQILKAQQKVRPFFVTGSASLFYTDNVALTRNGQRGDGFGVIDAGFGWAPKLPHNLEATLGLHTALFRYFDTTELDFANLGASAGLAWSPPNLRGATIFGRYDFTELLNNDGDEILMDHNFTLGVQKSVAFGRSHGMTFGLLGMVGISNPDEAQRDQIGGFVDYRLMLTRKLEAGLLVRPAVHFYNDSGRVDFNHIFTWSVRYRLNDWSEAGAFFSYGLNRSDRGVFDYGALTTGGGFSVNVRF